MKFTKTTAKAMGSKGGSARRDMLTQQLVSELNELDVAENVSKARKLVRTLIANAIGGDTQAIREIWDRVEGKPVQINENHNITDPARLSDDDLARLLSERLLNGGAGSGVLEKANGKAKPH